MIRSHIRYRPQPKQALLHRCPATEILYGGAAGGGKSHALRFEGFDWCVRVPGLQAFLFRRTHPELEKNHILPALNDFPQEVCRYRKTEKRFQFTNGSCLHMCHCRDDRDLLRYQGAEIHLLLIDEVTHLNQYAYEFLRGRVRCTIAVPPPYRRWLPRIVCAGNPGGPGHAFAKTTWIDFSPPLAIRRAPKGEGGMLRCYIPARLEDNEILMSRDPGYAQRLDGLPPNLRRAWRDGDWDIFAGQVFDNWRRDKHVIKPFPIPHEWKKFRAMDWGSTRPFSIGWYAVDFEGRLFRYREWYGWNGKPNTGAKLDSTEVARRILDMEAGAEDQGRVQPGPADPAIFSRMDGPSVAERMADAGVHWFPGNNDRLNGLQEVYSRLDWKSDGEHVPGLQFFENCAHAIRTLPAQVHDPRRPEDVDTNGEDHVYDEVRMACMSRPWRSSRANEIDLEHAADVYVPLDESGY